MALTHMDKPEDNALKRAYLTMAGAHLEAEAGWSTPENVDPTTTRALAAVRRANAVSGSNPKIDNLERAAELSSPIEEDVAMTEAITENNSTADVSAPGSKTAASTIDVGNSMATAPCVRTRLYSRDEICAAITRVVRSNNRLRHPSMLSGCGTEAERASLRDSLMRPEYTGVLTPDALPCRCPCHFSAMSCNRIEDAPTQTAPETSPITITVGTQTACFNHVIIETGVPSRRLIVGRSFGGSASAQIAPEDTIMSDTIQDPIKEEMITGGYKPGGFHNGYPIEVNEIGHWRFIKGPKLYRGGFNTQTGKWRDDEISDPSITIKEEQSASSSDGVKKKNDEPNEVEIKAEQNEDSVEVSSS